MIRRIGRVARHAVALFLGRVVVEPVREGRLREVDWPLGLRPIVVLGLVGYGVAGLLVLASGPLREWVPLASQGGVDLILPRALVWIVLALTAYSMTLAVGGALHASAWFRWLTTAVACLVLLATASPDQSALPLGRIVAVLAAVCLVVLVAVRGHRRFAWGEFAIVTALIWGSLATTAGVLTAVNRPFGYDFLPLLLSLMLSMLGQLAIPAAIAAGAAVASFTVSSALWAAKTVRTAIGPVAVLVVLGLVAVWRTVDLALGVAGTAQDADAGWRLAGSVLLLALIVLAWWALARLRRGRGEPEVGVMIDRIDTVALAVAALSTSTLLSALLQLLAQAALALGVPTSISQLGALVAALFASTTVVSVVRGLGGVALLVLAVVQARRGRRTMPELYAAIGIGTLVLAAGILFDFPLLWNEDGLALVGGAAALLLLVVQLVRRRLTPARATSLLVALLMSALFAYREIVTDPIAYFLGFAGAAVVLFGFVWSFLTDSGRANGDSPRYPRPARVQLVLANALFGITVLAFVALARDPAASIPLGALADYGGRVFGDPLVAAGLLLALRAAVRGREVGEEGP